MDLTPKQQTSEAIRQAETILITTGSRPSVDQVAATLALAAILRKFGKKVSAIVSDPLPATAQWMDTNGLDKELSGLRDFVIKVRTDKAEVDSLRYEPEGDHLSIYITPYQGGFTASDVSFGHGEFHYDLAIVLGVSQRSRIDRVYSEHQDVFTNIPLINIDFRRANENYGAVNLVEPAASSLCEMLVATSESLQSGLIDAEIATIMLGGIMAATDRFTATHTTSKSLTVAAQMMAAGADQQSVVRGLYSGRDASSQGGRDGSSRERPNEQPRSERGSDQPRAERDNKRRDGASGPYPARNAEPARNEAKPELRQTEAGQVAPSAMAAKPDDAPTVRESPVFERVVEREPEVVMPRDERPASISAPEEPLIEPNHIELMSAEMAHDETAREELAPSTAAEHVPMADFTAAAEILRSRDDDKPAQA